MVAIASQNQNYVNPADRLTLGGSRASVARVRARGVPSSSRPPGDKNRSVERGA